MTSGAIFLTTELIPIAVQLIIVARGGKYDELTALIHKTRKEGDVATLEQLVATRQSIISMKRSMKRVRSKPKRYRARDESGAWTGFKTRREATTHNRKWVNRHDKKNTRRTSKTKKRNETQ